MGDENRRPDGGKGKISLKRRGYTPSRIPEPFSKENSKYAMFSLESDRVTN